MDWRLLDWDYCCSQSPQAQAAHELASFNAEYGVSWPEFIEFADGLDEMVQAWWDALPAVRKCELLESRYFETAARVHQISNVLKDLR